jgi:adenylate cyclase
LDHHNAERALTGLAPLEQGIGVHHGPVVAGHIGTTERLQYTVVGDTVNLASRLEAATKELGVPVLLSAEVVHAAGDTAIPAVRRLRRLEIRGREGELEVWTLDPERATASPERGPDAEVAAAPARPG